MDIDKGLGDALRVVEKLAQDAVASAAVANIKNDSGAHGLPAQIPLVHTTGPNGKFSSVKPLLEEWRTAPERRAGIANVRTLRSFIELTLRHKDAHSALFAQTDWPNPSLTAVIDYHQTDGAARFGAHRIVYPFPLTPEFKTWIDRNGKPFGQAEFAEFIEDNIMDLSVALDGERTQYEALFRAQFAVPTDLIALSRGLQIYVESRVKNSYRLESGEAEIRFDTEHKNADGGDLHVPGLFLLSCRAFVDGGEVRLPARLRYRVKDGVILWFYQLYKWEDALRQRIAVDLAQAAKETELPAFEGAAEAALKVPT